MMKHRIALAMAILSVAILPLLAQGKRGQQTDSQSQPAKASRSVNTDRGQQVFEQNCSRCHNPPEGFPPRISGAIAMHMRVRANLSDANYKALLHFLNP
jgi:mono/diheme cytochrome c family protein